MKDNRVCKLFISYLHYTIKSGICTENAEFSMIFAVKCTDDEWRFGKLLSVVLHFQNNRYGILIIIRCVLWIS